MNKLVIKLLFVLALIAILFSIYSQIPPIPKQSELLKTVPNILLHEKCIYPTVKICNKDETGGGTGFITRSSLINNKYCNVVICAAHVISPIDEISICFADYTNSSEFVKYTKYDAVTYAINKELDLAILCFVSDKLMPTVEVDFNTPIFIDTPVFHVGCGALDEPRLDYGSVTQPKLQKDICLIRTNVFTIMGDSGGPLFLESNYKVIGMAHKIKILRGVMIPNISYYIPVQSFKTWNDQSNNCIEFVYNHDKELPILPYLKLSLKDCL